MREQGKRNRKGITRGTSHAHLLQLQAERPDFQALHGPKRPAELAGHNTTKIWVKTYSGRLKVRIKRAES